MGVFLGIGVYGDCFVYGTAGLAVTGLGATGLGTIGIGASPLIPRVALDANALIKALDFNELEALKSTIAGRVPTISITAAKEYLAKGDINTLRTFLVNNGGYVGKSADAATIQNLQNQASLIGRVLHIKDANVVGSALYENAVIITRDIRLVKFLKAVGIPVEGW